jgi:hypothetical protein
MPQCSGSATSKRLIERSVATLPHYLDNTVKIENAEDLCSKLLELAGEITVTRHKSE